MHNVIVTVGQNLYNFLIAFTNTWNFGILEILEEC